MKKIIKSLFVLLTAALLSGCTVAVDAGGSSTPSENPPSGGEEKTDTTIKVTGVSLDVSSLSLAINDTYQLTTTVYPNNATNKTVSYASNNLMVASVNANGKIIASSVGDARITVTTKDGNYSAVCNVNVYEPTISVTAISIDKTSLTLEEGQTGQINVTYTPNNATNKRVNWESSNSSVATITNKGVVTALKEGSATLTAKAADYISDAETPKLKVTCSLTVNKKPDSGEEVDPTPTPTPTPDPEPVEEARMQDTPILHCWNWSMNTISSKLSEIKQAGFKTIQLSPMQPQKDYYSNNGYNESWGNGWWKLYQPLGFVVATKNHSLGTKSELTALCTKAKSMGIDVIVDVVSNHLAGGDAKTLNGGVKQYESTIYTKNLIHQNDPCKDWEDPKQLLTHPLGGYPDLQTENVEVQNRVISLLKEYIDCGVNGFRFDAAKHIETPDDGTYASDYWPNVIGAVKEYAKSKGLDEPYSYGETLNTIGRNRKYTSYSKYMSITDTRQGSSILGAVTGKSISSITDRYISGVDPSQLVLWAESHDTYADKSTLSVSVENIHKAYMIQTSRKDASTLYFARPNNGTKLGEVGREDYKNVEIKAINDFHNTFVGQDEDVSVNNGCFINIRGKLGAAIVGISNSSSTVTLNVSNLEDGNYKDLVTSKDYTVSAGKVTVTLSNNACVLVNKDKSVSTTPEISFGSYEEVFGSTQSIPVTVTNATKVTYSINGGTAVNLTGTSIALGSDVPNGKVTIKVVASNDAGSTSKTINLVKSSSLADKTFVITDMDTTYNYFIWGWSTDSDGKWYTLTYDNNIAGVSLGTAVNFIVVRFPKSVTTPDWSTKTSQTNDLTVDKKVYSLSEFSFK